MSCFNSISTFKCDGEFTPCLPNNFCFEIGHNIFQNIMSDVNIATKSIH